MTLKYKPAIALFGFLFVAGIAFSVEPGKRQRLMESDDSLSTQANEFDLPDSFDSQKKSTPATRKSTASKTRQAAAPKSKSNPFEDVAEQDAFLDDLLKDSSDSPKPVTPKTSRPKNTKLTKRDSSEEQVSKPAIPRLKSEEDLADSPLVDESPVAEKSVSTIEKSVPKTKIITRASAESVPAESKSSVLIPLVNLAPEELLSPQVTLNWHIRGPVTLGRESVCQLIVRNPGQVIAQQVSVEARLGDRVKLTSSQPQAVVRDHQLAWDLGNLQPDSEVVLEVGLIPQAAGELPVSAVVKFGSGSVTRIQVEEPLLAVKLEGNESIVSGETMNVVVTLLNPGTGAVKAARLEAQLPEGVTHENQSQLSLEVGEIPPGESRRIELPLVCSGRGDRQFTVKASGDLVPVRESELSWQVLAPDLQLEAVGPSRRFVSRPAQYKVSVANRGTSPAENVKVACVVPAGFKLKEIGQSGIYDDQSQTIVWNIERIEAGESRDLSVDATAQAIGQQVFLVRAQSDHGGEASATCETKVEGITSVALNITDLDDPVEVGTETGYELVIQNDGTQPLSSLEIVCEIPPEVEFLAGSGPTEVTGGVGLIRIAGISELQPGQELTYQLKVRGTREGNVRLNAKLTAAELSKPVSAGEATRIYED